MTSIHRVRAILKIDPRSTGSVLTRAHAISNGMGADPTLFTAPNPPLTLVEAQIAKVDAGEQLAFTRVRGAASARNVEREILVGMLESERAYVNTLCRSMPAKAIAIVEAAGMFVASARVYNTPLLKVGAGAQTGSVNLNAYVTALVGPARKKVFFNWQWTTDSGQTFHDAPSTTHAKTTLFGLTPLTTVGFRVSVTDKSGPGPWTQIVTFLIL